MFRSSTPGRFSLRRTALTGILVTALGALTFTGATAANAVNGDGVGSFADIQGQFLQGYTPLHLTGDIVPDSSNGNAILRTYGDETIDLQGHTLNTKGIVVEFNTTLTIMDSVGGGTVVADGSSNGIAGIVVASGTALTVDSGTVNATGGAGSAAIGGAPGVTDPIDQSRTLTGVGQINLSGGTISATAGSGAAAIGGASGENGGTVIIGGDAMVTANADSGQSVIGAGHSGSSFGSLDNEGTLTLATGQKLDVPSGAFATNGGTIKDNGEVDVEGSLDNSGSISVPTVNGSDAADSNITGNNFLVTFNANPVDETGALPAPADSESVRVFAANMLAGNSHEPLDYTAPGDYVYGWMDNTDTPWFKDTTITGDMTVYAMWDKLDSISLTSNKTSTPDGTSIALTVTGHGPSGTTNDQTSFATIHSSVGADDVSTAGSITLHGYGARSVSAGDESFSNHGAEIGNSNEISLTSTGSISSAMTITPTKPTVHAGVVSSFVVSGKDAGGVSLGNITNQVTWSGFSASKHDSIDPTTNEPIFGTVGTRTLKATIAGHSISTTVKVVAGAPETLKFVKPVTKATAGIPASFTVDGFDFAGNAVGNVTADTTFGAQNAVTGEFGSGNQVTFTLAGSRVAVATDGAATVTTPITVVHGAGAQFNGLPVSGPPFDPQYNQTAGSTEVYDHDVTNVGAHPAQFTVQDAYGNVFSDADLASTLKISFLTYVDPSYQPLTTTDVINKNSVTWKQAGSRYVVLTDGSASATLLQTVNAAATVDKKLTFNFPTITHYVGQAFSLSASPSDAFNNPTGESISATFTTGDKNATVSGSGAEASVTLKTVGKHTITAKATGYTSLSQSFTAIKDTTTPILSTPSFTASTTTSLRVTMLPGGSGVDPTGTVTLHYGSKSLKEAIVAGAPSGADFTVPKLALGNYKIYASYSGNSLYNASSSAKETVTAHPGSLALLKFVKAPTSLVAGKTVAYNVNGYDVNNNLIGSETGDATFAVLAPSGEDSVASHNQVTLGVTGSRTVTATIGSISVSATVKVTPAAAKYLYISGGTETDAGSSLTYGAQATDFYGNNVLNATGDVSSVVKVTSSVSSDKVSKNKVTFTKTGSHTLTFKYSSATPITLAVTITPGEAIANKYVFTNTATKAYPGIGFSLGIASADKYGNPVDDIDPSTVAFTSTGSDAVIDADAGTVTLTKLGDHTATATIAGVKLSRKIDLVKDTATVVWPTTPLPIESTQTFTISVNHGASLATPTGTVTIHYGSHSVSGTLVSGMVNINVPPLARGTYTFYVVYGGDSVYSSKTTSKVSLKVNQAPA